MRTISGGGIRGNQSWIPAEYMIHMYENFVVKPLVCIMNMYK